MFSLALVKFFKIFKESNNSTKPMIEAKFVLVHSILPRFFQRKKNAAVIILRYTMIRHNGL